MAQAAKAFAIAPETRDQLIELLEGIVSTNGQTRNASEAYTRGLAAFNILPHLKRAPEGTFEDAKFMAFQPLPANFAEETPS